MRITGEVGLRVWPRDDRSRGSIMALVRCLLWSSIVHSGRTKSLFSIGVLPRIADGQPKAGYLKLKCINGIVWDLSQCAHVSTSSGEDNPGLPRVLSADVPSAAVGKYLTVKFDNCQQSQLISQWLRQNCHCPECIDPGSNQRKVYADKLLGSPRLKLAHVAGISLTRKTYSYI